GDRRSRVRAADDPGRGRAAGRRLPRQRRRPAAAAPTRMTYAALRRVSGWLLLLPLAAALLLGPAAPASAHATLIGTDPAEGAVLDTAPERVTFTFNESVIGVPAGITVFDATGEEVASSATVRDERLLVDLDEEIGE